jgi:hypothetical protein
LLVAAAYKAGKISPTLEPVGGTAVTGEFGSKAAPPPVPNSKSPIPAMISRLVWSGDVPHQKWMNFYTKVLSKFAATSGLKLTLRVEAEAPVCPLRRPHTLVPGGGRTGLG